MLYVVHIQRSPRFPPLYVLGQPLISHKLIQKSLQAKQLGNEEAVLPGHPHHVGQWHEHIGGDDLKKRDVIYVKQVPVGRFFRVRGVTSYRKAELWTAKHSSQPGEDGVEKGQQRQEGDDVHNGGRN